MKLLIISALVLLGVNAFGADNAADEAQIKKEAQGFVEAWNKHDTKAMANFWAADGDVINPSGRVAKGKDEVEKLFTDEHTTSLKNSKADMTVDNIKWLGKDMALLDNTMSITGMMTPDGKTIPPQKMHVTVVAKKEGNDWKWENVRPYAFMAPPPGAHMQHDKTAKAGKMKK